jgi:hypothetical protein
MTIFVKELVIAKPRSLVSSANTQTIGSALDRSDHLPGCVARDNHVSNLRMLGERALQHSNTLRALSRARERDPEVAVVHKNQIGEIYQQVGAGNGNHLTLPLLAQQVVQAAADVVRSAGPDQINDGSFITWPVDTRGGEKRTNLLLPVLDPIPGADPRFGLLRDLQRRVEDSSPLLFRYRQVQ